MLQLNIATVVLDIVFLFYLLPDSVEFVTPFTLKTSLLTSEPIIWVTTLIVGHLVIILWTIDNVNTWYWKFLYTKYTIELVINFLQNENIFIVFIRWIWPISRFDRWPYKHAHQYTKINRWQVDKHRPHWIFKYFFRYYKIIHSNVSKDVGTIWYDITII